MKTMLSQFLINSARSLQALRIAWWHCLLVAICFFGVTESASAQNPYGPPLIYNGGTFYWYTGFYDPGYGFGTCDNYSDISNTTTFQVDSNGTFYNSGGWTGNSYNSGTGLFTDSSFVGVTSDIQGFTATGSVVVVQSNYYYTFMYTGGTTFGPDLFFSNNGYYYEGFLNQPSGEPFYIDSSPWYVHGGGVDTIDRRSGSWPASNFFNGNRAPQTIYVQDNAEAASVYTLSTVNPAGGAGWYSESDYYLNSTGQWLDVERDYDSVNGYSGSFSGYSDINNYFSGNFDTLTQIFYTGSSEFQVSINSIVNNPQRKGPLYISWNGALLSYSSTDAGANDYYWDGTRQWSVTINNGYAMQGSGPAGVSISGYYDPYSLRFTAADGTSPEGNFFALDDNGNPAGLPPGLTLLFGSGAPGHAVLGSGGAIYSPSYSYQRPDGVWGLKYANLPNGIYLVQDENGNYSAPPYSCTAGREVVRNALTGWPSTNIYPQQLFINGISCAMVSGSQYDSGAGLPRSGGVSYRASAYDLTVVLSWNWDSSSRFQGFITGKYGQSSSFRGSWDGLTGFTGLTNGALASVSAPTSIPNDGNPPQISVNGSALTFNSLASTALANAGTPGDVYTGPLGQALTIYRNGTTSFMPRAGGTAISGTYNAATHQFSFGTGGNSVTVTNSDGSSSNAVITATDTGGHNLATPIGGATNGDGVTELAGGLDVRGNTFTLGSWMTGNESVFGLGIAYGDAVSGSGSTAQLNLSTTRAAVDWKWIHPSTDGGSDQVTAMQLNAAHRVLLYDPSQTGNIGIVLDPNGANGNTGVRGTIRVWQRGDISMGQYVHGTQPPVPNGAGN